MRATGFTHVSVYARDLAESIRFYRELFGMEEVPSPDFTNPVSWLRVGDLQLHLLQSEDPTPTRQHFGLDVDDFEAAAKSKDFGALFAVSSSAGGPGSIDAGQESTVIFNLQTGTYVVVCVIPDENGTPHYQMGMLAPLTVTEVLTAGTEPTAETTVDLIEFSFKNLPAELAAGKHIWKVTDTGKQLHELGICKLSPGVTFDQVKAMLSAPPPASPVAGQASSSPAATPVMSGPPPFVVVAGVAPMSPGETNWAMLDLTAGGYFAICFVPDPKTGAPHFALGMLMPFTVK